MRILIILFSLIYFVAPAIASTQQDCVCIKSWQPVCGKDGKTYGNSCEADCKGVIIVKNGEC
ncbi:MAG: hypothetical protein EBX41_10725 [Chitinophagia bacterium]|nr:hypothetical protein [Chitinophagia bacterium]